MDGRSVGEHVVVALLLVRAGRHVAQVMDDARLVVFHKVFHKEKLKRKGHLSIQPSIGDNGTTILTSKPANSKYSVCL